MSRVDGSDGAHLSLPEFLQKSQLLVHVTLRHSVNIAKSNYG
jgi:hypothetical protein